MPREVRDLIYAEVWDADTVHAIDYDKLLESYVRNESGQMTLPSSTPWIVKPDVAGHTIACEALEWLYKNSLDIKIGPPDQISTFLTADVHNLGLARRDYTNKLRKLTCVSYRYIHI